MNRPRLREISRRAASSLAFLLALLPGLAFGQQSVVQGGAFTGGHVPIYSSPAMSQPIIIDSGPAGGGTTGQGVSELNITARCASPPCAGNGTGPDGTIFTINDAVSTNATGGHFMSFSAHALGGGLVEYGAFGTAAALPFQFKINNQLYQFPFTTNGAIGPGTSVIGDIACWNNTAGTLLSDCAAFGTSGNTVPKNNGNNTFSGNNIYSGTSAFSGAVTIGATGSFAISGSGSGSTAIQAQAAASGTLSLPAATDTLVGKATTDTLTNKTYDTAGAGNSFKVNGQAITAVTGANATALTGGTQITNSLASNTALSNTGNYFDGPSIAQGSTGTWFASGTVSLVDTAGAANFKCKLWDGTTVVAASTTNSGAINSYTTISLSGYLATPAANLRISCNDASSTSGVIGANPTSNGNRDSTLSAFRIN